MAQNLARTTRRCSAEERCASYGALGGPAKLSRGNPGPACYACQERRAASELRKEAARRRPAEGRESARRRRPPAGGDEPRLGGDGGAPSACAKGSCQRPAVELRGGTRLCREHAEAALARGWHEGRSMWALICDRNLREALASGDEEMARKWSGLQEEAKARLAQAEADLAAKEARAHR
jgi:hypothetical protein